MSSYNPPSELLDDDAAPFFSKGISYGDGKIKNKWVEPLDWVPPGKGLILDLGCGEGETKSVLESRGYYWMGLDIKKGRSVSVVADAHRLPFKDSVLDALYSRQVFEHLIRPWIAAGEAFRVLKPGGKFFGSMSGLEPFHNSYFNYTHWGVEQLLCQAGLYPKRIEAGASAFLIMLHHLVDGAGPQFSTPIAQLVVRPSVWLLRILGKAFIFLRYGKKSYPMQKIDGYFAKFALRFAGHIQFVAEKPEQAKS